ncbi:hypothetical protein [Hyphomicrobium sp.]|uniref:hypothetical protein n=1 Tax=Hyphomicrobium sp. TaxID=82 RepID=UPI002E37C928|nr:hypothetical protein [Hyphomicrobium sp.]HEX2843258.1 hypothetical protein [Hyphomicrobium sp.]
MYFFVFVAAAAALYFAVAAWRQPRLGVFVAAAAWLLYAVYEHFIANGTLCDANCNIRVDLLLIWPLVCIASLFGIYAPGQWPRAAKVFAGLGVALFASMAAMSLYIVLVEGPAAEQAAQEKSCAEGQSGLECPPVSSAGSATGAQ